MIHFFTRLYHRYLNRTDHALTVQTPQYTFTGYDETKQNAATKRFNQAHREKFAHLAKRSKKAKAVVIPINQRKVSR